MKIKKLKHWFGNLNECLTINLSGWDNNNDIVTYGDGGDSITSIDIANAFQHWGYEKIEKLLIHNTQTSATEQYEQFEKEIIKNLTNGAVSKSNYCQYLRSKIQHLQAAARNFNRDISTAYNIDLKNIKETTEDILNLQVSDYRCLSDLDFLVREVLSKRDEWPRQNLVITYNEVIGQLQSGAPDNIVTTICWLYAYQKRATPEEDDLAMWRRSQNVDEWMEDIDFLRDTGFFPHVILPERLSIAYTCYVLTAVEKTVQFTEKQLSLYEDPIKSREQELGTPIEQPAPTPTVLWNTDASALYDLFGQLMTKRMSSSGLSPIQRKKGDQTIKNIAHILHTYFRFKDGAKPSTEDIERQLQKMTQSDDRGGVEAGSSKRNRIPLDIDRLSI